MAKIDRGQYVDNGLSKEAKGELKNQACIIVNQFESGAIELRSVGMGDGDVAEDFSDLLSHALATTLEVVGKLAKQQANRKSKK